MYYSIFLIILSLVSTIIQPYGILHNNVIVSLSYSNSLIFSTVNGKLLTCIFKSLFHLVYYQ